jgi:hypothetical protein
MSLGTLAAPTTIANEIANWLNTHPGPSNLSQLLTNIHEAAHVIYHRDLGDDPQVRGAHWRIIDGKREWVLGSVECLPAHIQMNAHPVLVAKTFLGPRYIEVLLRGKESQDECWFASRRDFGLYSDWYRIRQTLRADLPSDLKEEVQRAIRRDFNDPVFQRRLWKTALEYEARIKAQN